MPTQLRHSVITPVYNRANEFLVLYSHMKALAYDPTKWEWIVVDDGSTDALDEAISLIRSEGIIRNLKYIKHDKNRGIHVAQNTAIKNAAGEFVTRIDSDDYLLPQALAIKDRYYESIPEAQKQRFAGVVGLILNPDGSFRSSKLESEIIDSTGFDLQKHQDAKGDRNFCIKTAILREHLLPEYDDTNWVPERAMWLSIDKDYLTRFINVPLAVAASNANLSVVAAMSARKRSRKSYLSRFYGDLLMLNDCSWAMTFPKRVKKIISFSAIGMLTKKENANPRKIIGMLNHKTQRVLSYGLLPVSFLAYFIKKNSIIQ